MEAEKLSATDQTASADGDNRLAEIEAIPPGPSGRGVTVEVSIGAAFRAGRFFQRYARSWTVRLPFARRMPKYCTPEEKARAVKSAQMQEGIRIKNQKKSRRERAAVPSGDACDSGIFGTASERLSPIFVCLTGSSANCCPVFGTFLGV